MNGLSIAMEYLHGQVKERINEKKCGGKLESVKKRG
jgi:hypothetical protein